MPGPQQHEEGLAGTGGPHFGRRIFYHLSFLGGLYCLQECLCPSAVTWRVRGWTCSRRKPPSASPPTASPSGCWSASRGGAGAELEGSRLTYRIFGGRGRWLVIVDDVRRWAGLSQKEGYKGEGLEWGAGRRGRRSC